MDQSSAEESIGGGGLVPNEQTASSGGERNDETGETASNDECDDIPTHPSLYYATIFLIVVTLLQILSTSEEVPGPFERAAGFLIPRFISMGIQSGGHYDNMGMDGATMMCPPDQWVDETFVARNRRPSPGLYSSEYDPRNIVSQPTLFPHCALRRWVQMEDEHDCPAGEEYVTAIFPPMITKRSEGKIPKIIHLSSPTNCLPSATVETLRSITHQHTSQAYTIYVHSIRTMDNFLFQREWTIFPQVKEAALCGGGKLNAVTEAVIKDLNVGNSTKQKQHIVDQISRGLKRDIWRYMILWEYGGITMGIDALRAILSEDGPEATAPQENLRKLMHQWTAEKSDGLLYFINNAGRQRLPYNIRIPLTDIMGMAPHHPLVYYGAKVAFRIAVWDGEKSITDMGRTTKVPPITEALSQINRAWWNVKTGQVMHIKNNNENSIHFVDGDVVLPPSLTSPRTTPWQSIFAAFRSSGVDRMPSEESINAGMRKFAEEQKYIPRGMFSCMEYTLDMYMQTMTVESQMVALGGA